MTWFSTSDKDVSLPAKELPDAKEVVPVGLIEYSVVCIATTNHIKH